MFFFGPKLLLLLKRHSLEIYYKGSEQVMDVEFRSSALRHLEVASRDEVVKTLVDAFKSANLKGQKAILALSDHIVFERLIPQEDPGNAQKEIAGFYRDIPLEEEHIAKKLIPLKGSILALAANRELYRIIIEVAAEFGWNIKAVIPMTPFAKLDEKAQLNAQQVSQILSADKIFKEADFLNENILAPEVIPGEEKKDPEASAQKTRIIITILISLFLISLIIGSLLYFKIVSLPFNLPGSGSSSTPAASTVTEASKSSQTGKESTASANTQVASVSAEFNRSEIRIHVLNGSEIAGQANKIKEKLKEIGYENVITGNIESSEASGSSIIYSDGLEGSVKGEINQLMDSLVEGITKTDEAINEFNAVITLGKLEKPIE